MNVEFSKDELRALVDYMARAIFDSIKSGEGLPDLDEDGCMPWLVSVVGAYKKCLDALGQIESGKGGGE